jgi:hypothetical protein
MNEPAKRFYLRSGRDRKKVVVGESDAGAFLFRALKAGDSVTIDGRPWEIAKVESTEILARIPIGGGR